MKSDLSSIVLVSDMTSGGAAVDCARLHHGLIQCRQQVSWYALNGSGDRGGRVVNEWPPLSMVLMRRAVARFPQMARRLSWGGDLIGDITMSQQLRKGSFGVINLHNIHWGMSFGLLERLPQNVPIVWTLHDIWPLTGYCASNYNCHRFEEGCNGDCSQVDLWGPMRKSPGQEWRERDLFFQRNAARMCFVSPSRWLAGCARARLPSGVSVEVIPYGLPLDVFKPLPDRRAVRCSLGLPVEGRILLCGASDIKDPRKGLHLLMKAVRKLEEAGCDRFTVVTFGRMHAGNAMPEAWMHAGVISDEVLLNLYYNACDVFVAPSLADNLPNTLIEATAAGTPCVTFAVGGCPEIVREGETGFVAKPGDEDDLASCLGRVLGLTNQQWLEMSANCRDVAQKEYGSNLQAKRYIQIFEAVRRC